MVSQAEAIRSVIDGFGGTRPLCVADIGSQSGWLKVAGDDPRNLYLSGPMGQAPSVALGVALARPDDQVVAFCGDGALAMNLTSLVTIAGRKPANLTVVVLDNHIYEYTRGLPTPSHALDWEAIGAAFFGAENAFDSAEPYHAARKEKRGPFFVALDVAASDELPPGTGLTPAQIRQRFREAVRDR